MYANYNQVKLWSAKSQLLVYFISLLKYLAVFLIPRYVQPQNRRAGWKILPFLRGSTVFRPTDLRSGSGRFRFVLAQKT